MDGYRVQFTPEAEDDLLRLYEFMLEKDLITAERAFESIRTALDLLTYSPYSCRKARSDTPFLRELVIPFGAAGYVALFEIDASNTINILAVRHQREDDYQ